MGIELTMLHLQDDILSPSTSSPISSSSSFSPPFSLFFHLFPGTFYLLLVLCSEPLLALLRGAYVGQNWNEVGYMQIKGLIACVTSPVFSFHFICSFLYLEFELLSGIAHGVFLALDSGDHKCWQKFKSRFTTCKSSSSSLFHQLFISFFSFPFLGGGSEVNISVQDSFWTLYPGIIPGGTWGTYKRSGIKPSLDTCKISSLPVVLFLSGLIFQFLWDLVLPSVPSYHQALNILWILPKHLGLSTAAPMSCTHWPFPHRNIQNSPSQSSSSTKGSN